MATENIGGISWYVDADTSPAVSSIREFDRVIRDAEGKLARMDDATKSASIEFAKLENKTNMLVNALRKQGNVITSNGVVLDKYGQVNERATRSLSRLTSAQTQLTKTAQGVNTAMAGMSRGAGQAGIQIQQFVGQVQGGQDPLLAFSQQAADIGIVLGAPMLGAIAGLAASLGMVLLPEVFKTTNALEEIEKATERVSAAMTLSVGGVAQYSKQMQMLKEISEGLLEVKLANLIADQREAMKIATGAIETALDDARGSFTTWQGFVRDVFGSTSREAYDAMSDLSSATDALQFGVTADRVDALEASLKGATAAGIQTTDAGREIANTLLDLIVKYKEGELTIKQFQMALEDTNSVMDETTDSTDRYQSLIDSLTVRQSRLRSQQLEVQKNLTLEKAYRDGVSGSMLNQIRAAYDKLIASELEIEKERDLEVALKDRAKAQREADRAARDEERAQERRRRDSAKRVRVIGRGVEFAKDIVGRGDESPEVTALRDEQEELDRLRSQGIISKKLYAEASAQIDREMIQSQYTTAAAITGSFSSSFGELAEIFKNAQGEQSTAFQAMFAISKAFAVAQAGLNLSKAISDALAWGGLTLPEKFASVAAITAAGTQMISAIAGSSYGGREHGGSVMANTPYEVGEKNKPELLMIPGNDGKVFSNAEVKGMMSGGNGGSNIVINNYNGSQVRARSEGEGLNRRDVIDIMNAETSNTNSRTMRNITNKTTASNLSNARRR